MKFDGLTPVDGSLDLENMVVESGSDLPTEDLTVGLLFLHDTHGLVVYCHDEVWRKVEQPAP